MKFKLNNQYIRWGMTAFLVIISSIMFYYFIFHGIKIKEGINKIVDITMPIIFGLVTAYLLTPVLNFVEQKVLFPICERCKIKDTKRSKKVIRGLGILITTFLFVAVIYLLIYMLVSQIVPSVENIVINFDTYTNNIMNWANKTLEDNAAFGEYVVKTINQYSQQIESWLAEIVPNTLAFIKTVSISVINLFSFLWDFIIGFILSIYLLGSKETMASQSKKILYAVFERDSANTLIRNFRFTHKTFIGFLGGKIIDSLIIGVICFVGTSIMNTPYAALVSVIIAVTNVIPFFGPFLGAIPSTILIFVVDPIHPLNCVYFVIFILVLQQFDGNILGPKILGEATGISGFWVIFAITLFGGLFGVLGMLVGVPIFSVIYAAIRYLVNTRLAHKNMPQGTVEYQKLDYMDVDENGECTIIEKTSESVGSGIDKKVTKSAGQKSSVLKKKKARK